MARLKNRDREKVIIFDNIDGNIEAGDVFVICKAETTHITATLPAVTTLKGTKISFKKIGHYNLYILANNSTIDGETIIGLSENQTSITIICDGAAWHII